MSQAKSPWDEANPFDENELLGSSDSFDGLSDDGADLTGSSVGDASVAGTDEAAEESEATVTGRVLCVNCGHNLDGQPMIEQCPNCGHAITDSVHGDALLDTASENAQRLFEASNLVWYPTVLLTILGAAAMTFQLIQVRNVIEDAQMVFDLGFFIAMVTPAISILGIFVLTRRRTVAYYYARYSEPATAMRLAAYALIIVATICVGAMYLGRIIGEMLLVAWFAIPNVMFLDGMGKLMKRLARKKLAKYLHMCGFWAAVLSAAALVVMMLRRFGLQDVEVTAPRIALIWLTIISALILWGVTLRQFVLARRILRSLKRTGG